MFSDDEEELFVAVALVAPLTQCGITTVRRCKEGTTRFPFAAKGVQRILSVELRQFARSALALLGPRL